jgi:hypothetical protein
VFSVVPLNSSSKTSRVTWTGAAGVIVCGLETTFRDRERSATTATAPYRIGFRATIGSRQTRRSSSYDSGAMNRDALRYAKYCLAAERRQLIRVSSTRRLRELIAASSPPWNVHIGAGGVELPGWVNTDVNWPTRYWLDATRRWPFGEGTVARVFSDNVIEHLRSMRPGGFCDAPLLHSSPAERSVPSHPTPRPWFVPT